MSNILNIIGTCSVCQNQYDEDARPPKFLSCHHRYCLECCINLVEEQRIKCPQCRKITLLTAGTLCVDLDLHTDHDFMALLTCIHQSLPAPGVANPNPPSGTSMQQPSAAADPHLHQPSTSRVEPSASSDSSWQLQTTEADSSTQTSETEPQYSRKGKALKKKFKKSKKTRKSKKRACSSSSEMDSSDSSSSDNEPKRKRKRFSSMKSEMDSLMRKTRVTASKGSRGNKEEKEAHFVKDLFLIAEADARQIPPTVEHASLARSGLGLRCDIQFKSSGSQNHVDRVLKKTFPRLREVDKFYLCTKAQGTSRSITIQHYSTPSAPVLKRLSGKLVVLVPIKKSLDYESSEEGVDAGVDCDLCGRVIPIRNWAHHIDKCTEKGSRSQKRKTY